MPVTPIERAVLGVDDPQDVVAWVGGACQNLLGRSLSQITWSAGRLAAVWQVELMDGTRVVLKARRPEAGLHERLVAAAEVQRVLVAGGVPLPEVVRPPALHAGLVVSVEAPLPADWYEPEKLVLTAASASQLATLVEAAAGEDVPAELEPPAPWCDSDRTSRRGELWPAPHDRALFGSSFGAVPSAARRLGQVSAQVLQPLWRSARRVIGHDDWEMQNLRLTSGPDRVVAIYDGDSLAALPEPVLVGTAAAVHLAGSTYGPAAAPDDVAAFIQEYERARGRGALDGEAVRAAAAWTASYNAACDAVLGQDGPGTFLDACERHAAQYLG